MGKQGKIVQVIGPVIDVVEGDRTQLVPDPVAMSSTDTPALPADDDLGGRRWPWGVLASLAIAAIIVAKPTKPVRSITPIHNTRMGNTRTGWMTHNAPTAVAAPLPPLKSKNTG